MDDFKADQGYWLPGVVLGNLSWMKREGDFSRYVYGMRVILVDALQGQDQVQERLNQ